MSGDIEFHEVVTLCYVGRRFQKGKLFNAFDRVHGDGCHLFKNATGYAIGEVIAVPRDSEGSWFFGRAEPSDKPYGTREELTAWAALDAAAAREKRDADDRKRAKRRASDAPSDELMGWRLAYHAGTPGERRALEILIVEQLRKVP